MEPRLYASAVYVIRYLVAETVACSKSQIPLR